MTATPFGRRSISLAMLQAQASARKCPASQVRDKWKLFRTITEARPALGISDRSLAVLHALLSFHKQAELDRDDNLIVFPSNRELSLRAHGMAAVTLRRHLAALVEAGLVIRRDSPNGKRYARRDQQGTIRTAFGFDLTPLLARARAFEDLAASIRAEDLARRLLRERASLHRRDIAKMILFAEDHRLPGPWDALRDRFAPLGRPLLRGFNRAELETLVEALVDLRLDLEKHLKSQTDLPKSTASDVQSERHIQTRNSDSSLDLEQGREEDTKEKTDNGQQANQPGKTDSPPHRPGNAPLPKGVTLGSVLKACPDIVDYSPTGIHNWTELVQTASLVRVTLGISPDAWFQAVQTFGPNETAILMAAILQRGGTIENPGGYLRVLTGKARNGVFSCASLLISLVRIQQIKQQALAGNPPTPSLERRREALG
ncbi:MAG: plasmid replication protein RepC [Phyllobacterium sp.]